MNTSSWPGREQCRAAFIHFVCLHCRTQAEAGALLDMSAKTLRKVLKQLGLVWVRPMSRFAPTLPPPEWLGEMLAFMRAADRAGRPVELPDDLLLRWVARRPHLVRSLAPERAERAEQAHPALADRELVGRELARGW